MDNLSIYDIQTCVFDMSFIALAVSKELLLLNACRENEFSSSLLWCKHNQTWSREQVFMLNVCEENVFSNSLFYTNIITLGAVKGFFC